MSLQQTLHVIKCAVVMCLFLGGCGANHYAVHHADSLHSDASAVIAVDAKQRFLLSNVLTRTTPGAPGAPPTVEKLRRYCAEPSPDVFSVLSQAFSGSGTFGRTAEPQSLNIGLQAAFSSSEAGTTIARTQTINMLKEMMYRTCERYLNGQIDDFEYPIIAARDQRIMTSILAIEQLTGAVLPKSVTIVTPGNASSGQLAGEAILALDNANEAAGEAKNEMEKAQKEYAEAESGSCAALIAKPDASVTDAEKPKLANCKALKSKKEKAEQEYNSAKAHYDRLAALAKPGASSATGGPGSPEIDKQLEQNRSQVAQEVARAVDHIVSMSFEERTETAFFCYRALKDPGTNPQLRDSCVTFLLTKVETDTERLKRESAEATGQLQASASALFQSFWNSVKASSDQVDQKKLQARIKAKFPQRMSAPVQEKLDRMKQQDTREGVRKVFETLPYFVMKGLADG